MSLPLAKAGPAAATLAAHAMLLALAFAPPAVHEAAPEPRPWLQVRLLPAPSLPPAVPAALSVRWAGRWTGKPASPIPAPAQLMPSLGGPTIPDQMPDAAGVPVYLPSSLLDRRPAPVTEPDFRMLGRASTHGIPVRLRLYIDRLGRVVAVLPLTALDRDTAFVAEVAAMFRATAFIPGRRDGVDTAAFMDIDLQAL